MLLLVNSSQLTAYSSWDQKPSSQLQNKGNDKKWLHLQVPHNLKSLSFSPDLVDSQLGPCGISRLWHQLLRCLTASRQSSILVGVILPRNLKPYVCDHAGLCGSAGCVLSSRWKVELWYLQPWAIYHKTPKWTWDWYGPLVAGCFLQVFCWCSK